MIQVDSSALVAIARQEPGSTAFNDVIAGARVIIGTPTLLEVSFVLPSMLTRQATDEFLEDFLADPHVDAVPFSLEMFRAANAAFSVFGKGRHPAKLNFGDCMSYAVAKVRGVPLLFKGNDFVHTDIRSALPG